MGNQSSSASRKKAVSKNRREEQQKCSSDEESDEKSPQQQQAVPRSPPGSFNTKNLSSSSPLYSPNLCSPEHSDETGSDKHRGIVGNSGK